MIKSSYQDNTEIHFRTPGAQDWAEAARQELNGANPFEKLQVFKGELVIQPYYQKTDLNQSELLLPTSPSAIADARAWQNMPAIHVTNEKNANTLALHYLNTGADGILFIIEKDEINYETLLAEISLEHCALSLLIESGYEKEAFQFLASTSNQKISGCIFYRQPKNSTQFFKSTAPTFATTGICINQNTNPIDELVDALEAGVTLLDTFTDQGLSPDVIATQIAFHINIDADFFLSIAKLKVLRKCWATILQAYNVSAGLVNIHASSQAWIKESFQPHGNLIKSTTAALAAIAGGCNYLTVQPESDDEPGNRASRLVSAVLREESQLSRVADPTAGSYYLESLINQLVEKSWQKFVTRVAL
ncbi:MAG: hypothetical protein J0L67_18045 [Cytophagales bacterium]|nr:hypothetical protein [Cytophagales bacterium]